MNATVATTYFGGLGNIVEPDDTAEVLGVVRYPHDWINHAVDRNVHALGPPEELLQGFKAVEGAAENDDVLVPSRVAWEHVNYEERYRAHLAKSGPQQVLEHLRERLREHVDLWLVCWERDVRYCHRRLLADVLVDGLDDIDVDVEHYPAPEEIEDPEPEDDVDDDPRPVRLTDFGGGVR